MKHWHSLRLFFGDLVTSDSKLVESSQNELVSNTVPSYFWSRVGWAGVGGSSRIQRVGMCRALAIRLMRSIALQKELFRPSLYLITAGPLTFPCQQPQCISPISWCTWPQMINCQRTALGAECLIVASQSPNYSLKHINIWFLYPVAVYWIFFFIPASIKTQMFYINILGHQLFSSPLSLPLYILSSFTIWSNY